MNPQTVNTLFRGLWAIGEQYTHIIEQIVNSTLIEQAGRREREPEQSYEVQEGVAIVSMVGPVTKYGSWFSTSSRQVQRAIQQANGDKDVQSILMVVDSPGGEVAGIDELAATVRASSKPVVAYIEDLGASAAYEVASQAKEIYANRSADVGSIGTLAILYDTSAAYEDAGIKVITVKTGEHKGAGFPGVPVSDEYIEQVASMVAEKQKLFVANIKAGRGSRMSSANLKEVQSAAVYPAHQAVSLGLVDMIGTFEDAYRASRRMGRSQQAQGSARSLRAMADLSELVG